ncbi:HipA N-terminal domain-containing protein [Cellulosimicrobium sp. CUA-896]|uniref:HipA N-terminal domain-containing protein n=1 Tax=Cellulosimicrobium sp. CUA-896 TaxID=1517881 RepID=UPI000961181A|nr:HipA N-terminal domain-containing protein [Cellulosimicrobium sp. CUA-896]OLT50991.1 hypothetical protein BJF88_02560 [Cellulosimicrobium sp. CUA-896]
MRLAFALYGRVAGIIERDGGATTLRYSPEHLSLREPTPLSLSMPVSSTTYRARPVEAYLRGLLPDHEEVRERWARKAGVRPGDTLGHAPDPGGLRARPAARARPLGCSTTSA